MVLKEHIERMEQLADLSEKIRMEEAKILNELELIESLKEALDVAIAEKENELENIYNQDKTNKELSNQDKRNTIALKEPAIDIQRRGIKSREHEVKILKIEVDHKKRGYELNVQFVRHW